MAKILLVEDDNNLREIYEARLMAEGYQIVSAADGEAALVLAKKELPDLVISDVMMPRISGFEMLDIMRNTEGLKKVKVIMLTALGQAEDKTRAGSLGADKYLVKSQVTLEDIVKSAAELLGVAGAAPVAPVIVPNAAPAPAGATTPAAAPPAPAIAIPITTPSDPQAVPPVAAQPIAAPAPAIPVTLPTPPTTPQSVPPDLVTAPATPPLTPATPVPVAPQPTVATPTAAETPVPEPLTQPPTVDNQLMTEAVKELIASTTPPTPPVTPAAPVSTPEPPVATPVAPATPEAVPTQSSQPELAPPTPTNPVTPPAPAATPPLTQGDGASVANKKIIKPIEGALNNSPPDITQLLAKEEGSTLESPPQQVSSPHQPGAVISPNPVSESGQPINPNNIAL